MYWAYHDWKRWGIHDNGENSGSTSAEELPDMSMEREKGNKYHGGENR